MLRNRNYAILLSGQVVSQLGNAFYPLAIYWFTLSVTHSRADLGYISALMSLMSLVSFVSGTFVDRWDRRRTMISADVVRFLLTLALAALAFTGHLVLPVIFVFSAALALVANFFFPAEMALLPSVVGMEQLGDATGLNQGASAGANLVGMGLGGFLMGIFGPALLLLIDALTFVASFVSVTLLRLPRAATMPGREDSGPAGSPGAEVRRFVAEALEGQRAIWHSGYLRRLLLIGALSNFAFMPLNVLDVAWVRQVLHLGAFAYGLFGAAIFIGIIAGSIAAGPLMRRFAPISLIIWSLLGAAVTFVLFSQIPLFVPDLAVLLLFGVSVGVVNPVAQTMVQREVPQQLMGRVMGSISATVQVATPLSALLSGLLATVLPLGDVFLGGGLVMGVSLLLALRMPKPQPTTLAQAADGAGSEA